MASQIQSLHMRRMPLSLLLGLSLILTRGASSPLPSTTGGKHDIKKRSLIGDGPLQTWEIALLILGALFGIMLLGFLGGICEVVLHGKIKQSNAEADSKLEDHGSRAMTDEAEFAKAEHGGGAEGPGGIADDGRYSWQPERMTTGLSDDSTLAGSDAGAAQAANPYGEQAAGADWDGATRGMEQTTGVAVHDQAHAGSQYVAWHGEDQLPPTPSRFVIDDVDSPGYEGIDDNANYSAYGGHLNPPPALPKNTYQHQDAGDQYWNEGVEGVSNAGSTHAHGTRAASDGYGGEQVMVPPAAYSGDGYSPAVMPDSADYLAEYRQSQLYLQQDDDWYTAAAASYGTGAGTAK